MAEREGTRIVRQQKGAGKEGKRRERWMEVLLLLVSFLAAVKAEESWNAGSEDAASAHVNSTSIDRQIVEMEIEYGTSNEIRKAKIEVALFTHQYPNTTRNFKMLCAGVVREVEGEKKKLSYVGVPFHRIVEKFVMQGGDVLKKNGYGSISAVGESGRPFEDEADQTAGEDGAKSQYKRRVHDSEGMVAMANSGPGTNGSQFYITLGPESAAEKMYFSHLDGVHTVFGKVTSGMEEIREIVKSHSENRNARGYVVPFISKITVTGRSASKKETDGENSEAESVDMDL